MPRIETTTRIAAPPHIVYAIARPLTPTRSRVNSAEVFFDFASFPSWNPLIRSLTAPASGALHPGTVLDAQLQMGPKHSPMRARPVVTRCKRNGLTWKGKVGHRLLLDTEHRFAWKLARTVCPPTGDELQGAGSPRLDGVSTMNGDAKPEEDLLPDIETDWIHTERFSGLFGWPFVLFYGRTIRSTFEDMNMRLKERAEARYKAEAQVRLLLDLHRRTGLD